MSETRTTQKRSTVKPSEQAGDRPVEVGVDDSVKGKTQKPAAKSATAKTTAARSSAAKPATTETAQPKKTTAKQSAAKPATAASAEKSTTVKSTAKRSTGQSTEKTTAAKPATKASSGGKKSTAKASATVKPSEAVAEQTPDTVEEPSASVDAENIAATESVALVVSGVEQAESVTAEQAESVATVVADNGQSVGGVAQQSAALESAESKPEPAVDGVVDAKTDGDVGVKRKRKMSVAGIVFTCIGVAIVLFLFFVAVTLAVDKFVKKSPVPSFFGTSTLIVTTGSMSGTIEDGDMIVVKKSDEYKIGDIITFLPAGDVIPTTHRIIRITDGKFYTKGDANNAEDTRAIEQSDIVGKVAFTVPHVGLFFRWIKDDLGWIYLVAVVVVIVAGIVLLKQFPSNKKINKD